jgi:hypothetical protein
MDARDGRMIASETVSGPMNLEFGHRPGIFLPGAIERFIPL